MKNLFGHRARARNKKHLWTLKCKPVFNAAMAENVTHVLKRLGIDLRDSPLFDAKWYSAAHADLKPSADLVRHFFDVGLGQQRSPNAFMDLNWYASRYPDVRDAGADPFAHYIEFGWREGRDPGPWFSTSSYLTANPDVREAGLNPLLHFLGWGLREGRSPLGVSSVDLRSADMCIRHEDQRGALVSQWVRELAFHGVSVRLRIIDTRSRFRRAMEKVQELLSASRDVGARGPFISINGAGLSPHLAQAAGGRLMAIFDDVSAARAIQPDLQDALSKATVATTSPEIIQILSDIPGSPVSYYPEPMSGAYLQPGSRKRVSKIIWRCPSPTNAGEPNPQLCERLVIAQRLANHGLTIISDATWSGPQSMSGHVQVRRDWAAQSCAYTSYGKARLVIVTPPLGREGEVTPDILIALASGALTVAPFTMWPALLARFGHDCPIVLYKDVEEIEAIAAHYLGDEEERAALADKGRKRLFGEPSYSAAIGELIRKMAIESQ